MLRNSAGYRMKMGLTAILTMMLLFVAACGANGGEAPNTAQPVAGSYPITTTDDTGTEITFEQAPEKVVTLVPSETEIMFAIGAGDQVVGVDEFSNYPEEAASKAKVGDMNTNIEAIVALNPDMVLASSGMNADAITKLRGLNIKVIAIDPATYDATVAKIELIGKIMDKDKEAATVADHMRSVKQEVADTVKAATVKNVYLEFSPGWSVGSGTFLDELVTLAGGKNVAAAQSGWFEMNAEEVIAQNPDVIIYPALKEEPNPIASAIASRPGWNAINAVKNNQLLAVTEDPLVRVGPRLADGLLELAKVIHPDLVK
ncbi:MAG: ABC transporter substrate-binding protein [Candidatus Pristimantibacillus sp.]